MAESAVNGRGVADSTTKPVHVLKQVQIVDVESHFDGIRPYTFYVIMTKREGEGGKGGMCYGQGEGGRGEGGKGGYVMDRGRGEGGKGGYVMDRGRGEGGKGGYVMDRGRGEGGKGGYVMDRGRGEGGKLREDMIWTGGGGKEVS